MREPVGSADRFVIVRCTVTGSPALARLGYSPAQADDIVTLLQQALQQSIEADRHYRDALVAAAPSKRCQLPHNASFRLAQASNARATATKQRFVARFNPLARHFGRRTWPADAI